MFKPKKAIKEEEEFEEPEPPQFVKKPVQKVEEVSDWSVQEIPTATTPVIYNARTKETYSLYEAIAIILNKSEE